MKRLATLLIGLLLTCSAQAQMTAQYGLPYKALIRLWDTDGTPLTGVTDDGDDVQIDALCDGTHSDSANDLVESDAADSPGLYELDLSAAEMSNPYICGGIDTDSDDTSEDVSFSIETFGCGADSAHAGGVVHCGYAGASSTTAGFEMESGETAADNEVQYMVAEALAGTGAPATRIISASNTTSEFATFNASVGTAWDTTTFYRILSDYRPIMVLDANGYAAADVVELSGDSAAADALEAALDGTGGVTITADLTGDITGNLSGNVGGTINGLTAAALADFFDTDSGTTYASAVAGSVVKESADNAGGSLLTVGAIADAVWSEAQSGHVTAGSFGEVATEVASILSQIGNVATTVWSYECEPDNVPAIQCDDAIAYILAESVGQGAGPSDGLSWDINTPDGNTNRIDMTYGTDNGDRTIALTAPTR